MFMLLKQKFGIGWKNQIEKIWLRETGSNLQIIQTHYYFLMSLTWNHNEHLREKQIPLQAYLRHRSQLQIEVGQQEGKMNSKKEKFS